MNDCFRCKRKHTMYCNSCRKNPKWKDNFIEEMQYQSSKWSLEGRKAKIIDVTYM